MARRRAGERFVKDAPYDVRDKDAEIRAATSYVPRKSSRNGAVIFNIATFIATCAAVLGIAFAATGGVGIEAIVAMLLAALLVRASSTGREEVVFSPEDREGAGKAAVARANELLAKEAAPELPLGDGVVANLLNKVAAGVSAFAQGTAMLAVSEETRDISGGFILKDGRIEVNCTFDALVRAEREQTAGEVAKLLFPEA